MSALLVLLLGACAATREDASAAPPESSIPGAVEARAQVERLNATLLDVAERSQQLGQIGREAELRPVVLEIFDVPAMARASLGESFAGLTAEQQERWTLVYTEFHVSATAYNWRRDRGARFDHLGEERASGGRLLVKTLLDRAGAGVDVRRDYLLEHGRGEAGDRWRVVDVFSPKNVSMVEMRRSEYEALLGRQGFDALVSDMSDTIARRRAD